MHAFEYYHVQVYNITFSRSCAEKTDGGIHVVLAPSHLCTCMHLLCEKITLSLSSSVPAPPPSRYLMLNLFWIDNDIDIEIWNILGEQRQISCINITKQSHISLSAEKNIVMFIHRYRGCTKIYCTQSHDYLKI